MTATGWTLDELTARVAAALEGTAYAGAPNGRVRDVPDARAIRWYATIGLVDRPTMRGRTALYGPRHLAQLVAIKRRQSEGRRIADIQIELAEAPDDVLWEIADLPRHERTRTRFWTEPPAPHTPPPAPPPALLSGVPLGGDVTLLLPGTPGPDDVAAIQAAAQPLLDLLAERGLTRAATRQPQRDPSPERGSVQ
ncbi:MerR family transcriptional regulator [Dactylosporangium aurantiacum]|uniref:MerR family transcriptional regulator n=1 Tax=Dactylosporangium aurantiacum TaxID=35754 RepID=A0A9Q9ME75_9ACTN|nr:MerR family transcriptional regulator [Dactylosporangium aurantiacum]MDG6102814.1 MerR family transcriptional regulator [Dactylosporangium aurantiacum]UWZ52944.1 MerR family transcriptional regulator [Dactylosporangium aurantiacum]